MHFSPVAAFSWELGSREGGKYHALAAGANQLFLRLTAPNVSNFMQCTLQSYSMFRKAQKIMR